MINEKEQIIIIAEEQYSKTTWYSMIIDGIKKETHKRAIEVLVVPENHIQTLPVGTIIVLLGSSVSFISSCINKCYNSKLRPIVAGFEIYPNNAHISYVTINRRYAMSENIKHLISAGANHIALFGINSSIQTDMLRLKGWQDIAMTYDIGKEENDVYYSDNGLNECLYDFLNNYKKYDAVACTNDYYATYLLVEAAKVGIKIPNELMVTGFGNIQLGKFTNPTLTTVALNLQEVGNQTFKLYKHLSKNPMLLSCSATLNSQIIARESTKSTYKNISRKIILEEDIQSTFEPSYEKKLSSIYLLEKTISSIDEVDFKILHGLITNISYEVLAENIYLSNSAFRYRLNKLFALTGTKSKVALINLINNFIPSFTQEYD